MLFHTGSLWRLYETGWLDQVDRFSSVSGGSIIAGVLAQSWPRLVHADSPRSELYRQQVVTPVRRLADRTIDAPAILIGMLPTTSAGQQVAAQYRRVLYGDTTLADLPEHPGFVINATNAATGDLVRFSRDSVADWRVGRIKPPDDVTLAVAVACSSACPPFLSPYRLATRTATWTTDTGNDLTSAPYRDKLVLTDGGVYDNLGLETTWKRCRTLFVSDGGGALTPDPHPVSDWPRHMLRGTLLIDHQVRALRKRQFIDSLVQRRRNGTYVGVRSDLANFHLPDALPAPVAKATLLANTATRLKRMPPRLQEQLINWGLRHRRRRTAQVRQPLDTGAHRLPLPVRGRRLTACCARPSRHQPTTCHHGKAMPDLPTKNMTLKKFDSSPSCLEWAKQTFMPKFSSEYGKYVIRCANAEKHDGPKHMIQVKLDQDGGLDRLQVIDFAGDVLWEP